SPPNFKKKELKEKKDCPAGPLACTWTLHSEGLHQLHTWASPQEGLCLASTGSRRDSLFA
ncbi:hypothetical protein NDU88_001555, partial [Pleurodeles waltl]